MQQWEYYVLKIATTGFRGGKVDEVALAGMLNQLGAAGWEIATAIDTNYSNGGSREINIVLKRPRA